MKTRILVIMIAVLGAAAMNSSYAQDGIVAATAHINYRVDKWNYEPAYLGNAAVLEDLHHKVDSIGINKIDSVSVYCYASPEGTIERNIFLARMRAKTTTEVLNKEFPELKDRIHPNANGESWQALRAYVVKDTKLSDAKKKKVLETIDADVNLGTKKWRMQNVLGTDPNVGDVYKYLLHTYYKIIRNATILVFHVGPQMVMVEQVSEPLEFVDNYVPVPEEEIEIPELLVPEFFGRETIVALKTNLLYDALTMLNFEIEVPIGERYSVMVEDIFPWWEFSKNKYALQNWEIGLEGRYWFKPWQALDRKLEGFFAGPYVMSAKYDIQNDRQFCWQGYYWSAGLTAGYSKSLGRNHWGMLEFSLSAGYANASYQHYQPADDYSVLYRDPYNAGRVMYIGPTKAKVSLVIPIRVQTRRSRTNVVFSK